ncbi:Flavin-containing monooxygenase [Trichinella spiralis]|uniref:Flavin-containing monooxygenase n=1 Tax=Trichinella spiralis TaxID=6334 RepID=A0ABR3KQL1_TRISP
MKNCITKQKSCKHDDPEPKEHLTYISTLLFIKLLTARRSCFKIHMRIHFKVMLHKLTDDGKKIAEIMKIFSKIVTFHDSQGDRLQRFLRNFNAFDF